MSYDFYAEVDTGGSEPHYIEPFFDDALPAFVGDTTGDGVAGTVMLTGQGYARCGNYTSNVSGMWAKCLNAAAHGNDYWLSWRGDDDRRMRERYESQRDREVDTTRLRLRDLEGKRMGDLAPLLRAAVDWGIEHIEELRDDNPENGWGNAEGAVTYLWDIQRFCEQHPDAKLGISS